MTSESWADQFLLPIPISLNERGARPSPFRHRLERISISKSAETWEHSMWISAVTTAQTLIRIAGKRRLRVWGGGEVGMEIISFAVRRPHRGNGSVMHLGKRESGLQLCASAFVGLVGSLAYSIQAGSGMVHTSLTSYGNEPSVEENNYRRCCRFCAFSGGC